MIEPHCLYITYCMHDFTELFPLPTRLESKLAMVEEETFDIIALVNEYIQTATPPTTHVLLYFL